MKSPIKAELVTWSEKSGRVTSRKPLWCHLASEDPIEPGLDIDLYEDYHGKHTSIYVELQSLLRAIKEREVK